jgi:hypothetical protein
MLKKNKNGGPGEQSLPSLSLVFGYIAVKDLQRMADRITVLSRLGYGAYEIATICGTTRATVHTLRSVAKSGRIRGKR